MSSSMPIPKRWIAGSTAESSSSSTASSYASPTLTTSSLSTPSSKGKAPVSSSPTEWISPRRPSLLGSSLSKAEHTVIDLAHEDGPPRLVTCVKSSQGFDWNQELFLPSYANHREAQDLEHRPDIVEEIVLTDEEAAAVLPQ